MWIASTSAPFPRFNLAGTSRMKATCSSTSTGNERFRWNPPHEASKVTTSHTIFDIRQRRESPLPYLPMFDSALPFALQQTLAASRTQVVFGSGALERLGAYCAGEGGSRILLVTDR